MCRVVCFKSSVKLFFPRQIGAAPTRDPQYRQAASAYERPQQTSRDSSQGYSEYTRDASQQGSAYPTQASRYQSQVAERDQRPTQVDSRSAPYQSSMYQPQSAQLGQRAQPTYTTAASMSTQVNQRFGNAPQGVNVS